MNKLKLNRKAKAYTLLELIVVLAISGVVIISAMSLYLFVQKQFLIYKDQIRGDIEINQFISSFSQDIDFAGNITCSADRVLLIKSNGEKTEYIFKNDILLKKASRTDTMKVSVRKIKTEKNNENNLLKKIEMEIKKGSSYIKYIFFKEYDNASLVNHKIKKNRNGN